MSYYTVILISAIVILSYLFNVLARKTNIPSVLMLILLGIGIKQGLVLFDVPDVKLDNALEVLGIVGLIMIVLEAALDLELKREKWPIIWRSMVVALLALVASAFAIAGIVFWIAPETTLFNALVYAIPLSIMSSAIIIPSVNGLPQNKKEFMIYESTFSDILGIMFFYFLIGNESPEGAGSVIISVLGNILLTIVLSVLISYALVIVLQKLTTQVKLFLLIAILLLFYSLGKLMHLSSLIIILVFGLVLNNYRLFFRGFLEKWLDVKRLKPTLHDFHLITVESAFVVRTFFFVIFGMEIALASLIDLWVLIYSSVIIASLYVVRWLTLRVFLGKDVRTELFIAPRGLITILLFYAIPAEYALPGFDSGILLFTILVTSIIMTFALIKRGSRIEPIKEVLPEDFRFDFKPSLPSADEIDEENKKLFGEDSS